MWLEVSCSNSKYVFGIHFGDYRSHNTTTVKSTIQKLYFTHHSHHVYKEFHTLMHMSILAI